MPSARARHAYLVRDCQVIAQFFTRRGVSGADGELLAYYLQQIATAAE